MFNTLALVTMLTFTPATNAHSMPTLQVQAAECAMPDDQMLAAANNAAIKVGGKVVVLKGVQADAALQVYLKEFKAAGAIPEDTDIHTDALIAVIFKAEGASNESVYLTIHRDGCYIKPVATPIEVWRKMYTEA